MTRIIAGFAGSLALRVPKSGTRPTTDRVREALFSALDAADAIRGARVLDLYAGSGALGLEAASRGAASVTLVERDAKAAAVARANAALIRAKAPRGAAPTLEVLVQPVATFLTGSAGRFDLAFLDPPYELGEEELDAALTALVPRLADGATVVVERSSRSPAPAVPAPPEGPDALLVLASEKRYGETTIYRFTI